jgi:hypothetical protein
MKYTLLKVTGLGVVSAFTQTTEVSNSLSFHASSKSTSTTALHAEESANRRSFLSAATASFTFLASSTAALADEQGAFSVDDFLKSGQVSMPMGVSGQAGKSKPTTGIIFRDGTDVSRDSKSGSVLAEIVMNAQSKDPTAVLTSFTSPWPLGEYRHFLNCFKLYHVRSLFYWESASEHFFTVPLKYVFHSEGISI